jgi:Na+/melibiose symporter-like transporter
LNAAPVPDPEPGALAHVNETLTAFSPRLQGARMIVSALVTFLVVILILYLINMLPIDGRAKQIARVVVIVLGVISLLKYIAVF